MSNVYRLVHDSMGEMEVPAERAYGAQTQRSLNNFKIGSEKMPELLIEALIEIKRAAARVNAELGLLDAGRAMAIEATATSLLESRDSADFPLALWQTGSGTQTNMNVNEVIAYLASERSGLAIHPNDHVNRSQSSNDVFPTAMHLAADRRLDRDLIPALRSMISALKKLETKAAGIMKVGRTHLQDAVPLPLALEVAGWRATLETALEDIEYAQRGLCVLAIGGTAVGSGLNTAPGYAQKMASELSAAYGRDYTVAPILTAELACKHRIAQAHSALANLASDLIKVANDIRFLASGPRCGYGELRLPENEPGSSIMPAKVNPTQAEALTMVAVRVLGNQSSVSIAASQGNFELNVYMPLLIYCFDQSAGLLADAMNSFVEHCLLGIEINREQIASDLERSLMTVTALTPEIGYEKAAELAKFAHQEGLSLREAIRAQGLISEERFDALMAEAFDI
ncbi:MAG: class II fumarate hydratase [Eubacteriales bacterium]|nr:class II fumarate hydratase [Eubacteriales bacterium]